MTAHESLADAVSNVIQNLANTLQTLHKDAALGKHPDPWRTLCLALANDNAYLALREAQLAADQALNAKSTMLGTDLETATVTALTAHQAHEAYITAKAKTLGIELEPESRALVKDTIRFAERRLSLQVDPTIATGALMR